MSLLGSKCVLSKLSICRCSKRNLSVINIASRAAHAVDFKKSLAAPKRTLAHRLCQVRRSIQSTMVNSSDEAVVDHVNHCESEQKEPQFKEISIPVPWGHLAGKLSFFFLLCLMKLIDFILTIQQRYGEKKMRIPY